MDTLTPLIVAELTGALPPALIFVPVDATRATRRVLDSAIALAQRRSAQIVLIGLLREPRPEGMDADEVQALLLAAECGYGVAVPAYATDEEARLTRLVRLVLLPYQQRVQAAGVSASIRVVSAAHAYDQVCTLLGEEALAERALMLGNPVQLEGSLHDLSLALLIGPDCTRYIVEAGKHEQQRHGGLRRWIGQLLGLPA